MPRSFVSLHCVTFLTGICRVSCAGYCFKVLIFNLWKAKKHERMDKSDKPTFLFIFTATVQKNKLWADTTLLFVELLDADFMIGIIESEIAF